MEKLLETKFGGVNSYIDSETGEIIYENINTFQCLVNDREQFWLMYSSMVLIMKDSSDVKMKLFAALLERYSDGQEFSMNKSLKEKIALESGCKARSLDVAFTELIRKSVIIRIAPHLYVVNPLHVFKGSRDKRNKALKAVIKLKIKE